MRYESDGKCDILVGDFARCGSLAVQEHVNTELRYCQRHFMAHRGKVEDCWEPVKPKGEGGK